MKKSVKKEVKKPVKKAVKKPVKKSVKKKSKATPKNLVRKAAKKVKEQTSVLTKGANTTKRTQTKSYAEIGAEGEQQIYNELAPVFGANCIFRNVYVMQASGHLTEIDLLAIHPTGIYVIESKNYSGLVKGDGNAKEWVQCKGENYTRKFYSPVAQNAGHIDALRNACQHYLGYIPPMLSLLVFPDRCDLQLTNLPMGLRCCRLTQLPSVLNTVFSAVESVLVPQQLQTIANLFYQSQQSVLPPSVQAQHMKDVALAKRLAKW